MGFAADFAKAQEQQKLQQAKSPAACHVCGSRSHVQLYAEDQGVWVISCEAYKNHYRCFLCPSCLKIMTPEKMSLIEEGDKKVLRTLPLTDIHGKYLPDTTWAQLQVRANFYPPSYLGEKQIHASIEQVAFVADCTILELVPTEGQDYMMDKHLNMPRFGCILTAFKFGYALPEFVLHSGCRVKFTSYWDEHDKLRVAIWRKP